jgi:hypothetical protein
MDVRISCVLALCVASACVAAEKDRTISAAFTAPSGLRPGAPPAVTASTGEVSSTPMAPLPGTYAIATVPEFHTGTFKSSYYLTAVGGGGRSMDVIHTDARWLRAWEKFTLWKAPELNPVYAIQTVNGRFLAAVSGGGRITDTVQTVASEPVDEGLFRIQPQSGTQISPHFAFQTVRQYFLTAVGNGGKFSGDTIHTDATVVRGWELFDLKHCGDPGTGSTYSLEDVGGPLVNGFLEAADGGRHADAQGALITHEPPLTYLVALTLIKQDDGTYAFKTSSGYYVTANSGGLAGAGYRTDTPQVGNWEKFTLIANESDCSLLIKTSVGTYISQVRRNSPANPADIIDNVTDISHATHWRTWVVAL